MPWMRCEYPYATAHLFSCLQTTLASVYSESKTLCQWEERDRMDGQDMSKTDLMSGDYNIRPSIYRARSLKLSEKMIRSP